jgi:hypothetical protein
LLKLFTAVSLTDVLEPTITERDYYAAMGLQTRFVLKGCNAGPRPNAPGNENPHPS